MGKEKVYTNPVRCKGCGYCMNACPQEAIRESGHVNAKGYNTVCLLYTSQIREGYINE